MKKTTSLCFTKNGFINPEAIPYLFDKDMDGVVLFGDGSEAAFEHMQAFDFSSIEGKVPNIGVGKTPLYEMRVINYDNTVSKPHFVYSDDVSIKWICSKICAHYLHLAISDFTSQSKTQVQLDHRQIEMMCYTGYQLWSMMLEAEARLCFPAIVIDRMTKQTYSLTPQTIDIAVLRREVGLDSLEYNSLTDMLSVTVADETFSVSMAVLNSFYGDFILPSFNEAFGRRLRIRASILEANGQFSDPRDISYGELGRLVNEMKIYAKQRTITADNPIEEQDFLAFAKKVKINEESCLWPSSIQPIQDFIRASRDVVVRPSSDNDRSNGNYFEEESNGNISSPP